MDYFAKREFLRNFINKVVYSKDKLILALNSSNTYNSGNAGLMSVNDNNRLIVRAFAYAWRYKKFYERGIPTKEIAAKEKMSKRTVYNT